MSTISEKIQRSIFVIVALFFVLFTSCPVKSSIKTWIGIPVNTEKAIAKNNPSFFGGHSEQCTNDETKNVTLSQPTPSVDTSNLLPTLIFTVTFFSLLGATLCREQVHPLYGNLKIVGTLPIFIRYRKFLI